MSFFNRKIKLSGAVLGLIVILALIAGGNLSNLRGATEIKVKTPPQVSSSSKENLTVSTSTVGVISVAAGNPQVVSSKNIAGNSTSLFVARYMLSTKGEAFKVTEMTFENRFPGNDAVVKDVVLKYSNSLSSTALNTTTSTILSGGYAEFKNLSVMVPANSSVNVEVWVNSAPVVGKDVKSGAQIAMDYDPDANFKAIGQTSKQTVETFDNHYVATDIAAYPVAFYKTLPKFEQDTTTERLPCPQDGKLKEAPDSPLYCFKVTADLAGDVGLKELSFNIWPTDMDAGYMAQIDGLKLLEYTADGSVDKTSKAVGTYAANLSSLRFDDEAVVLAGATRYYMLTAPIQFTESDDLSAVSTNLAVDTGSLEASASASNVVGNYTWSDRSAASHSAETSDWNDGLYVKNLSTPSLMLTE